ncbi:MAG: hypothetical protein ACP5XB_30885, partial [Isosphaeraceae bacterium]
MKIPSRSLAITLCVSSLVILAGLVSFSRSPGGESGEAEVAQQEAGGVIAEQAVPMPPGAIGLEIELGLNDTASRDWDGKVEVSDGKVLKIEAVRSPAGARVEDNRFFVGSGRALTKKKAAA